MHTISSLSYTFGGLLSPGDTGTDVHGFVNLIIAGALGWDGVGNPLEDLVGSL